MGCGNSKNVIIESKEKINCLVTQKTDQATDRTIKQEEEEMIATNEIQKEAFEIAQQINQIAAGSADRFQLRNLRQRLQKLDLQQIYAPYNIIMNLIQAISCLFINRGTEVNFLAELKYIATLCRILVVTFLGKKSFLTSDHSQNYQKIISDMKNIMSKTQKEMYDFGFQLEIQIIDKVIKMSQDEQQLTIKLIQKAKELYNIGMNKDFSAALNFIKDAVKYVEENHLNTDLPEATVDMDLQVKEVELEKINSYESPKFQEVIEQILKAFRQHQR